MVPIYLGDLFDGAIDAHRVHVSTYVFQYFGNCLTIILCKCKSWRFNISNHWVTFFQANRNNNEILNPFHYPYPRMACRARTNYHLSTNRTRCCLTLCWRVEASAAHRTKPNDLALKSLFRFYRGLENVGKINYNVVIRLWFSYSTCLVPCETA